MGGAEVQLIRLAEYLRKENQIQPLFLFLKESQDNPLFSILNQKGIPHKVFNFSNSSLNTPINILRISRFFIINKVDGVIAFLELPCLLSAVASKVSPRVKFHIWGIRSSEFRFKESFWQNLALKCTDQVISNSKLAAKNFSLLNSKEIRSSYEIKIIPNAISESFYQVRSEEKNEDELSLIMVANHRPPKRYDVLLSVMSKVREIYKGVLRVYIVGRNTETLMDEYSEFKHLSPFIFCVGFIDNAERFIIEKSIDIGLFFSDYEGQPNVVMEYMKLGLPVVATKLQPISDLLPNENSDYLFSNESIEEISEAIVYLLINHEMRTMIGKKNSEHVVEKHSLKRIGTQYYELIRTLKG